MKESNFQTEFGNRNILPGCFELKFVNETKRKSLPFKDVKQHQNEALLKVWRGVGLYHKIADAFVRGYKASPKPFDCFRIENYPAYVVVMWWIPRKKKMVYYIPIGKWTTMELSETMKEKGRKSATEAMMAEYSNLIVNYLDKS